MEQYGGQREKKRKEKEKDNLFRERKISQFRNRPAVFLFPYFNHSGGFLMFLNCDLEVIVAKAGKLLPR